MTAQEYGGSLIFTYHADEYIKSIKPLDARIELIDGNLVLRVKYEMITNYQKFNVEFPNIQLTARAVDHMVNEYRGVPVCNVTLSEEWFISFQMFPEVGERLPFRIESEEPDPYQVYEEWIYKMEKGGS